MDSEQMMRAAQINDQAAEQMWRAANLLLEVAITMERAADKMQTMVDKFEELVKDDNH